MTKKIRVENADNSLAKVIVEVWETGLDGNPDAKVEEHELTYPTDLRDFLIYSTRYLIVKENGWRE